MLIAQELNIQEVKVSCPEGKTCQDYQIKMNALRGQYKNLVSFKEKVRFSLIDQSIKKFSYQLFQLGESHKLLIEISSRDRVKEVIINVPEGIEATSLYQVIPFREGGFYVEEREEETLTRLKNYLKERGVANSNIFFTKKIKNKEVYLNYKISVEQKNIINNVIVNGPTSADKKRYRRRFDTFLGLPLNPVDLKLEVSKIEQELLDLGYYSSTVSTKLLPLSDKRKVSLILNITYQERTNFHFYGNTIFSQGELLFKIKEYLKTRVGNIEGAEISRKLKELYRKKGFFHTEITFDKREMKNNEIKNFFFSIVEGNKKRIRRIEFLGNKFLTDSDILDFYYEKSSELAGEGFYDQDYLNKFPALLKKEYLRNGFVRVEIEKFEVKKEGRDKVVVDLRIFEGQQTVLDSINLDDLPVDLALSIKKNLVNQSGKALNVIELENDIAKILELTKNAGYYYAQISNLNDSNLLKYSSNFNKASLNISFDLNKKTVLGDLLITGYKETRLIVIEREINLSKGDIITPQKLEGIRERLIGLGIFSRVRVSPVIDTLDVKSPLNRVNLVIAVDEKEFGSGEVAPGFRTDLGAKVSTEITWKNLQGMNRSLSLKAQTNYRLNLNTLDVRRKTEDRRILEGSIDLSFTEPYLFGKSYEFKGSTSYLRRRFFSFDANIARVSPQVSKVFNEYLSGSLGYQFEFIDQFDTTNSQDDGKFRIGSFTPSITLDLRDNAITPTRGAFFNLSWELANPLFGSENDDELEVNYHRLISRNNFYIPVTDKFILAFSYSFGFQKNLANDQRTDAGGNLIFNDDGTPDREGFIPSIKVFRLDGINNVRGFADSEINRLNTELDISETIIDDEAYFTNFKFEPRYFLSDTQMIAGFFDAGRVSVNSFKPLDLRTSAGLSLKFLTPVGSLDFDYGVKLRRRRLSNGAREGFGRFHLTIGFF